MQCAVVVGDGTRWPARTMHRVECNQEVVMGAKIDRMKGTAQQIEGKLTGDKVRMAQGTVTRTKAKIEGGVTRIAGKVKSGVRQAEAEIRRAGRARDR